MIKGNKGKQRGEKKREQRNKVERGIRGVGWKKTTGGDDLSPGFFCVRVRGEEDEERRCRSGVVCGRTEDERSWGAGLVLAGVGGRPITVRANLKIINCIVDAF